ncbi:MAG: hypothetical protein U0Q22_03795 [Acidimicrobiales bacterium]
MSDLPPPFPPSQGPPPPGTPSPPGQWPTEGYQPYGYAPAPGVPNPFSQRANTVLILGIIGMSLCQITGPFAWVMGRRLRLDAEAAGWPEPGHGKLGRILGIIATCMLAVAVVVYGLAIVAAVSGSSN